MIRILLSILLITTLNVKAVYAESTGSSLLLGIVGAGLGAVAGLVCLALVNSEDDDDSEYDGSDEAVEKRRKRFKAWVGGGAAIGFLLGISADIESQSNNNTNQYSFVNIKSESNNNKCHIKFPKISYNPIRNDVSMSIFQIRY